VLAVGCGLLGLAVGWFLNPVVDRVAGDDPPPRWQRAVLTVVTGVLFAAAGIRFGADLRLPNYLLLFAALAALSVVDVRVYRIPDRIVFPVLAVSVVGIIVVSVVEDITRTIGYAGAGGAGFFVVLLIPHLISPRGMGFGDVKLSLLLGLHLGWLAANLVDVVTLVFSALMLGCLLGIAVGLTARFVRGGSRPFPFGPALATGTVVVILASSALVPGQ
jgi:leader peptidase (prepilin peptidase)/N-methyltransferase